MNLEVTNGTEDRTEKYRQQDEGRVPVVLIVDGINAQKHEDDRLRAAAQHLHGIFDGCVGLWRNVTFNIILHRDATKRDSVPSQNKNLQSHT